MEINRVKTEKKREKNTHKNKQTNINKEGKGHIQTNKQANRKTQNFNLADVIDLLILLNFSHGQCI